MDKIEEQKHEAKSIVGNYFAVFGGRIASVFLGGAVLTMATRALGPERFGMFSLFLMVAGFFTTVFVNWQNSAVLRFGREEYLKDDSLSKVFSAYLAIFAAAYILSSALIIIFRSKITGYIGVGSGYVLLVMFFIFTSAFYDISFYVLQAAGRLKTYSALPIIEKLVALAIFFTLSRILYPAKGLTLTSVVLGFIGGQAAVIFSAALSIIDKKLLMPLVFDIGYIRKIIRYSWAMPVGAIATFIVNWVDVIFLKKYMPLSDVGVYSLAYRGMGFFSLLIMSTIPLTFPIIVSLRTLGNKELIARYIDELVPQGVFLWSMFLGAVVIFSGYLIPLIFGQAYTPASKIFSVLLVGVAFQAIGCFYSGFTGAFDIVAPVVGISVVISFLKTLGDFIFIPHYGTPGAAYVSAVTSIIANILYLPVLQRWGGVEKNPRRYLVALWGLPVIVMLIIGEMTGGRIIPSVIYGGIASVLLFMTAKISHLFNKDTTVLIDKLNIPDVIKSKLLVLYRWLA